MNSAPEPQLNTSDNSQTVHNVMQRQATSMPNGKHDFFIETLWNSPAKWPVAVKLVHMVFTRQQRDQSHKKGFTQSTILKSASLRDSKYQMFCEFESNFNMKSKFSHAFRNFHMPSEI